MRMTKFPYRELFILTLLLGLGCRRETGPDPAQGKTADVETAQIAGGEPSQNRIDLLFEDLTSGSRVSRENAAEELCRAGKHREEIIGRLREFLKAGEPETRRVAAYTLG